MTATNLLKAKLAELGLTQSKVAELLKISKQAFSCKLHNKTEFKASEIEILCSELGIRDKDAYFFTHE